MYSAAQNSQNSLGLTLKPVTTEQFTVGIQGRTKVHFAKRNSSLFYGFTGRTQMLTVYEGKQAYQNVLLFEQNTESCGDHSSRPFYTTLQRLQQLTDSLLLKQEFVRVRQSRSESQSATFISLVSTWVFKWSTFYCGTVAQTMFIYMSP